jgi:hypothetical protein
MVIDEARLEFARRESAGALPGPKEVNLPIDEIIRRSKPADDDSIDIIAWHAQWLCRWTFFPDPFVRDTALDTALETEWHR